MASRRKTLGIWPSLEHVLERNGTPTTIAQHQPHSCQRQPNRTAHLRLQGPRLCLFLGLLLYRRSPYRPLLDLPCPSTIVASTCVRAYAPVRVCGEMERFTRKWCGVPETAGHWDIDRCRNIGKDRAQGMWYVDFAQQRIFFKRQV